MNINDKMTIKQKNRQTKQLLERRSNYIDAHSKKILYEQGNVKLKRREQRKINARKIRLGEE